ncbi:MAG: DUF1385 domain-containing protein [Gaiellales bacterium]
MAEKHRLGGLALQNGVLVHGPTSFGVAIRRDDGSIATATGRVPRLGSGIGTPVLRGPMRLAESLALLPVVKRALPEVAFSFERRTVAGAMATATIGGSLLRRSPLPAGLREATAALASIVPAIVSLRGGELTSYHGAEHVSIGSYEQDGPAEKEHVRCGSHLVGRLIVTSLISGAIARRAPARARSLAHGAGAVGAVGLSIELLGWMSRNPKHPVARALARPGYELQHRLSTSNPTPAQLEVANAALVACLTAEAAAAA